jgi:ATP-dependent DNA helicase Rep
MISKINYEAWLLDTCANPKMAERKMENVNELLDWLKRLLENKEGESKTLTEVVQMMVLMDILERNKDEKPQDSVQLMTLHAAKGLEFPYVFLAGMEEEILPHRNSIEDDNVEEERRLAYVGMTRAKKTLTLSLCKHRRTYSEIKECVPSRFLEELPKEDLIWDGNNAEVDPVEREKSGMAHLAAIKAMLSGNTSA